MSTQSQRAMLLRHSVAEFERRVQRNIRLRGNTSPGHLGGIGGGGPPSEAGLFRPSPRPPPGQALEGLLRWRSQEMEGFHQCACGQESRYKGQQKRSQETFVGRITWQRGYYYCESCRRGQYPLDEAMDIGPGQFSDGLQKGLCRLGSSLPFELAAESFTALTGVSMSPREVERLTEGRGEGLEAYQEIQRDQGLAGQQEVNRAAEPSEPGVWVVALDAAKVRFDDGWHDVKAGVVFWAEPLWDESGMVGGKVTAQSYVAEAGPMEQAGARLYMEAAQRGIDPAQEMVVCLGDGAPANWSQFGLHFPKRVEVLDWYHAEHLWAGARDRWGGDSDRVEAWVEVRKEELWAGGVEAVLTALRGGEGEKDGQAGASEVHYFETNRHRMGYAELRAKGYPIGSGTVESACKRIIGARLKQAGMRWTKAGAQAVLSLRSQLFSGRWDAIWPATRPQLTSA